jgi:hypothetical protein
MVPVLLRHLHRHMYRLGFRVGVFWNSPASGGSSRGKVSALVVAYDGDRKEYLTSKEYLTASPASGGSSRGARPRPA